MHRKWTASATQKKPAQATSTTATPCARVAMEIPALLVSNRKVVVQLACKMLSTTSEREPIDQKRVTCNEGMN